MNTLRLTRVRVRNIWQKCQVNILKYARMRRKLCNDCVDRANKFYYKNKYILYLKEKKILTTVEKMDGKLEINVRCLNLMAWR